LIEDGSSRASGVYGVTPAVMMASRPIARRTRGVDEPTQTERKHDNWRHDLGEVVSRWPQ